MQLFPFRLWLAAALWAALAVGCGPSGATVSGDVSYDGQAVADGTITFLPADGKGAPGGGKITAGRYTVAGLAPGPKVVQITSVKKVTFARSSEEMAKMAAAAKAKGKTTGLIDPADLIPPSAVGNNSKVDVQPGPQTRDFALKKPDRAR